MRAGTALIVSIAVVCLWPAGAGADAGPDLREGDRAMESLDYGRAVAAFERVTSARDATAQDLVHAYTALVRCQVVLGNEASARLAAEQLLELDPGAAFEGGNIPPRVSRFFDEFRRGYQRTSETVVLVSLPDRIPSGRAMDVSARITRGRRGVATLRFLMQFGDAAPMTVELAPRDRRWVGRVQVPGSYDPAVTALRYWVEARAPSGAPLGGLGSEDEPMVVAPTGQSVRHVDPDARHDPERRHPLDRQTVGPGDGHGARDDGQRSGLTGKWWFWTGIAAVVAGGILSAAIIATDQGDPARHGSDGDRVLR